MILYHISMDLDIINEFFPRIPGNRFRGENNFTPRISLSSSIEGCLTAVPFGGSVLTDRITLSSNSNRLIRVYEFDTSHIPTKHIIYPNELYRNDLVRDADITKEHWVTTPLTPIKTYLIKLLFYSDNYCKDDISYEYLHKFELGEIEDITPYIEGSITIIDEVEYEIIPDERRSNQLEFCIDIDTLSEETLDMETLDSIINELYELFPYSNEIFINIEKIDSDLYLVGNIDTKYYEIDILDTEGIIKELAFNYSKEFQPLYL